MKSLMVAAALCAAFCISVPAAQAATSKMTDVQIYCSLFSWTAKCTTPAAPVKAVAAKPAKVAIAKPAAPKVGLKVYSCVPAAKGKAYLYECVWK